MPDIFLSYSRDDSLDALNRAVLVVLPKPFEWCEIDGVRNWEMIDHNGRVMGSYDVEPFYMAKYPITYEQYQVFVDDPRGYKKALWWRGLDADVDHRKEPGKQYFTHDQNLPRENVSWYDTIAFCRWLSVQIGPAIMLPTEWQWQWAAQGPDGLAYPYGNDYDSTKCNTYKSGNGKTTPVTEYPGGASPFGVMDMSGNVWEWCLNAFEKPTNIEVAGSERRVSRGGSWSRPQNDAHTSYRSLINPYYRSINCGFRVACGRPPSQ